MWNFRALFFLYSIDVVLTSESISNPSARLQPCHITLDQVSTQASPGPLQTLPNWALRPPWPSTIHSPFRSQTELKKIINQNIPFALLTTLQWAAGSDPTSLPRLSSPVGSPLLPDLPTSASQMHTSHSLPLPGQPLRANLSSFKSQPKVYSSEKYFLYPVTHGSIVFTTSCLSEIFFPVYLFTCFCL